MKSQRGGVLRRLCHQNGVILQNVLLQCPFLLLLLDQQRADLALRAALLPWFVMFTMYIYSRSDEQQEHQGCVIDGSQIHSST